MPDLDTETAPQSTSPAWPTTDSSLLVRPPAELDLSRSHLWFSRPVDGNNNPSAPYRFGMTYNQRLSPHRGIDIANDFGTHVLAVGVGTVFYAGEDIETLFGPKPDFYGRLVVIEMADRWEGDTIYTLYGHLESVNVSAGQPVNPGDEVGLVGSSGVALGPHLHFEVRQDDPYPYDSVRNPELWYWPYSGRGVLVGRLVDANGIFLPGTRVNLDCSDGTPRYVETYWDQYTAPDDILVENFVISDLPAGTCRVWAEISGEIVEQSVEILPGELGGVVLQIRP
jgi:murein DD-endopeptidase MepM/ murein hydrolase activator NlpD